MSGEWLPEPEPYSDRAQCNQDDAQSLTPVDGILGAILGYRGLGVRMFLRVRFRIFNKL